MVLEGESFLIRCHSWRNLNVKKVTYYRNGKFLQFWYDNYNITINNATETDSGTYYCTGWISKQNHISNFLNIVVRKGEMVKKEGSPRQGKGEGGHPSLKWLQHAERDSRATLSSPQACREEARGGQHISQSLVECA